MKFISLVVLTSVLFGGCFSSKVSDPINANPAAEKELEKNDTYVPWWAASPSAANGVIILTNTTPYKVSVITNSNGTAKMVVIQ